MPATPAWPPRSAPRLFVSSVLNTGQSISVEGSQAHYLLRVMRLTVGDAVILCDDLTGEWVARVSATSKRDITLDVDHKSRDRENVPDFWLCVALVKKPHFDMIIEKATELGVARIQPVLTRRCVVDKINPERIRTIMIEAAEQCARTALPICAAPEKLDAMLRDWPADRKLFFADESGGAPLAASFADQGGAAGLLIGPEGGFAVEERAAIRNHPAAIPISLGPRILRAETAAIAATACWMTSNGDWR